MSECIFCLLGAGKIPSHTVYEDERTIAFLDLKPHAKGHTVVIPKKHGETVFDLDKDTAKGVMNATIEAMARIQKVLAPDGFNVGWNHNSAGGQVVPHLHIHILPRYRGDGGGSVHSIVKDPGAMSVEAIAKLFA